ncbi:MAG: hypothetical protein AAF726_07440 [Planctomycetota bacterium]
MRRTPLASACAGFTLAEAAITIAIVAFVVTVMLQGLEGAKTSAAHTRYLKTAYELGNGMLGEITAGLWSEEIESGMTGTFADLDEPDYGWEIALGDDMFEETGDQDDERPFDNYAARRDWESDQDDDEDEDEEDTEPFEKVKLRVRYPKLGDYPDELVLELWAPWDQVYGADEEEEAFGSEGQDDGAGGNQPPVGGGGGGGG